MKTFFLFLATLLFCTAGGCAESTAENKLPAQVRGVWMPDPGFTPALTSYENLVQTVEFLSELKFNTLFVCTLAGPYAAFPSETLFKNGNYASLAETQMKNYRTYNGGSGDVMADLIAEAHKRNIRVIFWYEYGFEVSHGAPTEVNPLYAKNPDWMGRANDGGFSNYNNSDFYFNSYDPRVQNFLLDLVKESLEKYPEVDGIQGDDRMPAAPRNSGYDSYTSALYKKQTGAEPPYDFNDPKWVRWRLDILNQFGKTLYDTVKGYGTEKLVCFSPNPYPWCEQNLMQDWPTWLSMGIVDLLSVQCYRYTTEAYVNTTNEASRYVKEHTSQPVFNPGIILRGEKDMPAEILRQQMEQNRKIGSNGEAFFWYEALKSPEIQAVIRSFYN